MKVLFLLLLGTLIYSISLSASKKSIIGVYRTDGGSELLETEIVSINDAERDLASSSVKFKTKRAVLEYLNRLYGYKGRNLILKQVCIATKSIEGISEVGDYFWWFYEAGWPEKRDVYSTIVVRATDGKIIGSSKHSDYSGYHEKGKPYRIDEINLELLLPENWNFSSDDIYTPPSSVGYPSKQQKITGKQYKMVSFKNRKLESIMIRVELHNGKDIPYIEDHPTLKLLDSLNYQYTLDTFRDSIGNTDIQVMKVYVHKNKQNNISFSYNKDKYRVICAIDYQDKNKIPSVYNLLKSAIGMSFKE